MTLAFWFWVIFVVSFLFFGYRNRANTPVIVDSLAIWILLALLGFGAFGSPVQ